MSTESELAAFTYELGDRVRVFYRATRDNGQFVPIQSQFGARTPRIGLSHGWQDAIVTQVYSNPADSDFVVVRYCHQRWVGRDGEVLETQGDDGKRNLRDTVHRSLVRFVARAKDTLARAPPLPPVSLSLLFVRWASTDVDPVDHSGDHGGWGETGSNVSDKYIENWLRAIHSALGCDYEVLTAWVEGSEDLVKLGHRADGVRAAMRGRHRGAFYFMWPVAVNDGTLDEGYVKQEALLHTIMDVESAGVATRFPHASHLYRTLLSKEWMSMLCLDPALRCPATTNLCISSVQTSPYKAAEDACKALHRLAMATAHGRAAARGRLTHSQGGKSKSGGGGGKSERGEGGAAADGSRRKRQRRSSGSLASLYEDEDVVSDSESVTTTYDEEAAGTAWRRMRGVAKLGFSWEAADVLVFDGVEELGEKVSERARARERERERERERRRCCCAPPVDWLVDDVYVCILRDASGRVRTKCFTEYLPATAGQSGRMTTVLRLPFPRRLRH